MITELVRMVAIDVALVLVLILIGRNTFLSSRDRTMFKIGVVLLLLEDAIRWTISLATGFASSGFQVQIDLIRQWVSLVGTVGAVITCAALLAMAARDAPPVTQA